MANVCRVAWYSWAFRLLSENWSQTAPTSAKSRGAEAQSFRGFRWGRLVAVATGVPLITQRSLVQIQPGTRSRE